MYVLCYAHITNTILFDCVLVVWCMYYVMHKLPILYCLTVCVSCVMYVLCYAQITDTILFDCVPYLIAH